MKRRIAGYCSLVAVFVFLAAARNNPSGDIQPSGGGGNSSITSPLDLGANGQLSFGPDATGAQNANQRICIGTVAPVSNTAAGGGYNGIAIGSGASINTAADASGDRNICLGAACSIGVDSGGHAFRSVAIGPTATILGYRDIALGNGAACYGQVNTAIGNFASVGGPLAAQQVTQSLAIGNSATNPNNYSVALGAGATVTVDHQIMLGTSAETVVHPGPTTLTGALTANANVTVNGATALNGNTTITGTEAVTGAVTAAALGITGKSQIQSSADGYFGLYNNAATGFTGLRFGGVTSSSPMLKSTGTTLAARLADDSADAPMTASRMQFGDGTKSIPAFSFLSNATSQASGMHWDNSNNMLTLDANTVEAIKIQRDPSFPNFGNVGINMKGGTGASLSIRGDDSAGVDLIDAYRVNGSTPYFRLSYNGAMIVYNKLTMNYASSAASPAIEVGYTGSQGLYNAGVTSFLGFATAGVTAGNVNSTQQWGGIKWQAASKTANYTVLTTDSATLLDNTGAAGQVVDTLPAAVAGLQVTVINTAAGSTFTKIVPAGTDKIAYNGALGATGSTTGSLVSTTTWTSATLSCVTAGTWVVTSAVGSWTLN